MKAGSLVFRTSFKVLDIVEFETGRKSEGGGSYWRKQRSLSNFVMEEKETMKNSVKSKRNRVHYMAHVSLLST